MLKSPGGTKKRKVQDYAIVHLFLKKRYRLWPYSTPSTNLARQWLR
jgi:hypothetical protein